MKNVLVTGAAGFIGAALVIKLLENGENVIGFDDLNSYYDPQLKESRLKQIELVSNNFLFHKLTNAALKSEATSFQK